MKSINQPFDNSINTPGRKAVEPVTKLTSSTGIALEGALISAINRGWQIVPVLAESKYFPRNALAGAPTSDPLKISHWAGEFSNRICNWAVEVGARSELLILGVDYGIGSEAFKHISGEDRSWCTSLQFTDSNERFICFRYSGEHLRNIGLEFPGVRLIKRGYTLVPPSVLSHGEEVSYLNPHAVVHELPYWLTKASLRMTSQLIGSMEESRDLFAED